MSASVASPFCADERVPRWSSTRHADPRPHWRQALLRAPHSSQRSYVIAVRAMPDGASSSCSYATAMPSRIDPTPFAAVKSP